QNEKINYVYSLANGIETVQETVIVYRDLQASSIKEQTVITRSYERNALGDVFKYTQNTSYPDSDKDTVYVEKNYDADGKLVSEVKQAGTEEAETTTYLYNSDDELETITYPGGRTETYVYTKDGKGRLTQKTLTVNDTDITGTPFSHTETTDYNPETGEVTSFTDKDGNITTYSYVKNTRSDVVENTVINDYSDDPENLKRKVTIDIYDADGNLISHSEEVGGTGAKITTYTYNDDGTTESVTYPLEDGETQSKIVAYEYTYDSKGKLTVYVQNITEPDGTQYSISEEYNADGNIVKTIDKDGAVSTYSYLRSLTGKLLEKTVTELDSGQNPVYIEKFDGRGNLIYTKDVEKNLEKEFTYIYENEYTDEEYLKTLIETVTQNVPDAQAITYTAAKNFNAEGQIIEVSSDINSDVKTTSYSYYGESETGGKEGDLKQVIDAKGNKTEYFYEYDAVEDFLTKKTVKYYENNDGALVLKYTLEQQYDVKGRLISDIDKYGVTKTYQYTVTDDVVTQVIESVNYTDENSNTIFYSTTKNYSADGKKLVGETLPDGTTKTYTYDAETGDLLESTGNEVTITYTYNVDTGVLESSLEFNNKGTAEAADDIQKLTLYFGDKDKEQIKEIRTFPAGADTSYKPIIRELFHYNSSGVLYRTIKKELKDEFKGTVGTIVESEYKEILETIYGVYNGKVRKKREIGREAREDYIYDEDGILSESVVTNGIYYSKTYKEYNFDGDVIKITKKNGLESIVTDVSYVKNSIGLISDKTETVTYKKYDENGSLLESEVISVTSYEYYGKLADDKTLYPVATKNHEIKTMISGGKTHVYEYTYDANGYIEMSGETVTWSEGANSYNVVSYKKFNQKGDIISSIDEDGTYSEYFYSSEAENEMGGRVQTQKVFYKFKNPADETLGYELYRVTSFGEVDITGLSVSEFRRTYDFENDLVEVVKKNSDGSEIDDQITSYIYEKDQYG
ncbi:MAG: hypothetical protein KAQ99_02120, partial [Candidatus Aureabacteria bacterium]|nr:hypothetical protein [Candidatus Auribacterota bacterium]